MPQLIDPMRDDIQVLLDETDSPVNKMLIPFIVCGDLRGYDSDMSYSLNVRAGCGPRIFILIIILNSINFQLNSSEADYVYREVVQKPINPAYAEIIKMTEKVSLKHSAITQKGPEDDNKE